MENESIKSEPSSRSRRSRNHFNSSSGGGNNTSGHHRDRNRHSHRSNHSKSGHNTSKQRFPDMAPFQTNMNMNNMDERSNDGQEVIEVQILPQDDTWGENTTAITGNTSEQSISMEDLNYWQNLNDNDRSLACQHFFETALSVILSIVAFVSPLAMVVLPKIGLFPIAYDSGALTANLRAQLLACNAECKGKLVSLSVRMVLLALGVWALYFRRSVATMPRIFLFRATIVLMVLISTFAFWLFYIVQVTEGAKALVEGVEVADYKTLVGYAISFADTMIFIHYIAVVLMEVRHLQPTYYVKVVRSPDGESQSYSIGQLSIQRAAVWVLQKYYTDFTIYNPYLERLPISKSQKKSMSSFKYYEVDGISPSQRDTHSRAVLAAHARRRDSSHNERFYEEHEYERRVKKRRARLITAAEEAFTHIKRIHNELAPSAPLSPQEAAQSIFPSMARALQKYLRVTRQQPRHTVESILKHLADCLKHDLSPRAFLEPYLIEKPVMQSEKECRNVQNWALISDELLSRPVSNGCTFQLIQNDISLLVYIKKLPHFNIAEQVVDPKSNKFILNINSETSV